jgi:two-component system response regulator AdeR
MRERSNDVPRPFVLVADDNADTREMYALYRSMSGYGVTTAEDGHEAVVQARTLRPDVIVMDLQMPRLNGWGAIRELQSRPETSSIPIIVLTGHDFKAYLKPAALAVGACSLLMSRVSRNNSPVKLPLACRTSAMG